MAYIEMVHSFKRCHMGSTTIAVNNDVNFSIEQGELAIILGASGTGKSTVLNILGGMDTNSEGQVIINGKASPTTPPTSSPTTAAPTSASCSSSTIWWPTSRPRRTWSSPPKS